MLDATTKLSGHSPSYFQTIKESKITDVVLVTCFVALTVIGILASVGVFQFMGAIQAAHLSYYMYASAFVFLVAEIVKCATSCKKIRDSRPHENTHTGAVDPMQQPIEYFNNQITKIVFSGWQECSPARCTCEITFLSHKTVKGEIDLNEASDLMNAVDSKKCFEGDKNITIDNFKISQRDGLEGRVHKVLERLLKNKSFENVVETKV